MLERIKRFFTHGPGWKPDVKSADVDYGVCDPASAIDFFGRSPGELEIADVNAEQTEFKTYAEALSWTFKTGKVAIFNWDEAKGCYVRKEV
jgi:hypothetical protein